MSYSASPEPGGMAPRPAWPLFMGSVGLVLSVIIMVDQLDDLRVVGWTQEDWAQVLDPQLAEIVAASMPPPLATVLSVLVTVALAVMLLTGSLDLRRYRIRGVHRLTMWSWLAVIWTLVSFGGGLWWFRTQTLGAGINFRIPAPGAGYAIMGMAVALAVMLAYPVFLLVWFNRPSVRAQVSGWEY